MDRATADRLNQADTDHAIEIADRIWWVGHYMPDDPFQCHAYLIEHGDQSVLFDPGSKLTFTHTLRKIEEVIPFTDVRWFVCHHQDPDITGALTLIDQMVCRPDAAIVTHWRAKALIRHYGLNLPFWLIDANDWRLDLGERVLRFVFTPYLHFPGAFVTLDEATGVLFSSDLFGGFTEEWSLVARDGSYFEAMRPFHEHYMPSRDILTHGLMRIAETEPKAIAPQHGSIIPEPLVMPMIEGLKTLDCGLYLMVRNDIDIIRLSKINRLLRDVLNTMVVHRDFREIAMGLLDLVEGVLPVTELEFWAVDRAGATVHLSDSHRFRAHAADLPAELTDLVGIERDFDEPVLVRRIPADAEIPSLVMPLFSPTGDQTSQGVVVIRLASPSDLDQETAEMLSKLADPLEVAIERELLYRELDQRRNEIYEQSIRDPLTGLYNRMYLHDAVQRIFALHDRHETSGVAIAMFDIDHFKSINDTWGHGAGDVVLTRVANVLARSTRAGDVAVRLGGEEFVTVTLSGSAEQAWAAAERIRELVAAEDVADVLGERTVTISAGLAMRRSGESLPDVLARADAALYDAKRGGRNRVAVAEGDRAGV